MTGEDDLTTDDEKPEMAECALAEELEFANQYQDKLEAKQGREQNLGFVTGAATDPFRR